MDGHVRGMIYGDLLAFNDSVGMIDEHENCIYRTF